MTFSKEGSCTIQTKPSQEEKREEINEEDKVDAHYEQEPMMEVDNTTQDP